MSLCDWPKGDHEASRARITQTYHKLLHRMPLTPTQLSRAIGVLLGTAAGDALGAGYEFGEAFEANSNLAVDMIGGGPFGFEPYEWTDDTAMAITLARGLASAASDSQSLSKTGQISNEVLDNIVNGWYEWSLISKDVGAQTRSILSASKRVSKASGREVINASDALGASKNYHAKTGRSGGNGSLMRTAPLALAFLLPSTRDDANLNTFDREASTESALMRAASLISALTHWDRDAREACGIWCIAIRHAVLTGELDIRRALKRPTLFLLTNESEISSVLSIPAAIDQNHSDANARVQFWESLIAEAEISRPSTFTNNGWVIQALQGAWSAICCGIAHAHSNSSPTSLPGTIFHVALESAVRGGNDTDTVAAIAGGLMGAVYGIEVVPEEWMNKLHGWPGLGTEGLVKLVKEIVQE